MRRGGRGGEPRRRRVRTIRPAHTRPTLVLMDVMADSPMPVSDVDRLLRVAARGAGLPRSQEGMTLATLVWLWALGRRASSGHVTARAGTEHIGTPSARTSRGGSVRGGSRASRGWTRRERKAIAQRGAGVAASARAARPPESVHRTARRSVAVIAGDYERAAGSHRSRHVQLALETRRLRRPARGASRGRARWSAARAVGRGGALARGTLARSSTRPTTCSVEAKRRLELADASSPRSARGGEAVGRGSG